MSGDREFIGERWMNWLESQCISFVLRLKGNMRVSAGSFELMDSCLIFIPFGHYDEPEILLYENPSICPKGVDVTQNIHTISGSVIRGGGRTALIF